MSVTPPSNTVTLRGTKDDQDMAEVYWIATWAIVLGHERSAKDSKGISPLAKFLLYREACQRTQEC